jgi:oxygen-independent coproporphyrinogen-3 oxidase
MSGIYIHIPFCKQKCSYCDFHFSTSYHSYRKQMIESLCREIFLRKDELSGNIDSIYIGGGTPSLLERKELRDIFQVLRMNFDCSGLNEITLEANPDDINPINLEWWRGLGINRLSIGLQSFKVGDLKWMNRAHTVSEGLSCISLAREYGFDNISVDLIYGLPGLSISEWKNHIETILSMGIEHLSAYCLTIEKGTRLHQLIQKGKIIPAGENIQCEQYDLLANLLVQAGYEHYEVSNFGKPGYHAIHNGNYWKGTHYIGVGPSAHSYNGVSRRWNIANNSVYMKMRGSEWFETEELGAKEQWNELILTGLRTSYGVDKSKLFSTLSPDQTFHNKIENYKEEGWVIERDNRLILSQEGRLKADYLASELFK